jgi:CheY-like chemotaxis protein
VLRASAVQSSRVLAEELQRRRVARGAPPVAIVLSREHRFGRLMRAVMNELGFEVHTDEEHAGAVQRLARFRPDLVILDINLAHEHLDWAILEGLREHPGTSGIPVVVCSAASWVLEQRDLQLRRECVAAWTEPYSLADLVDAVRYALAPQPKVKEGS